MDKEKLARNVAIIFIAVCLVDFFYFKLFFYENFLYVFIVFGAWALLEVYIRIQHNIDNKFLEIKNLINSENKSRQDFLAKIEKSGKDSVALVSQSLNESASKFFLMKSDLEFRLIGLKEQFKKQLEEINSTQAFLFRMLEIMWIDIRKKSLFKIAPELFNFNTVLYIGASKERTQFLEDFIKNGYNVTILEIFSQNVEYLRSLGIVAEVIEGDIRNYRFDKKFDVVFWWHGPEHVSEQEFREILPKLEAMANKMVVFGCPFGEYIQKESRGNKFEEHQNLFNEGYFEKLGFKTDYTGKRGMKGSNISAVKKIQ